MLTPQNKEYFRRLLNNQLEELSKKRTRNPERHLVDMSEQSPDFIDQAAIESDVDFNIHLKERDGRLSFKIKDALERLEDGTYGICEECGEEISLGRLKARPVTTVCFECKKRQEAGERQRGL